MTDTAMAGGVELGPDARPVRRSFNDDRPGEAGTALPAFIDHHVHLMLVGADELAGGALAGVVDLGAPPELAARAVDADGLPRVRAAGAFLTARGGYPAGRPWAAPGSVRELDEAISSEHRALPDEITAAVDEQRRFGASVIKVVLHSAHGPVPSREALDRIVSAAREAGMPVVAHVEGDGMTRLAVDAGVAALAHTPFSERVDDELIGRAVAGGQAWISTLAIHSNPEAGAADAATAADNLRRFHAAGGRVLYGTDLGNGERLPGIDAAELAALLAAGLSAAELLGALSDPWPAASVDDWAFPDVATFVAGAPPASLAELPGWLAAAHLTPAEDLEADARRIDSAAELEAR